MDLASVVAALASVGVRVSGNTPNNNIQGDSSRACPTGLAGPEPSGTLNDPGQHFHKVAVTSAWSWTSKQYGQVSPGCYTSDMAEFFYDCFKVRNKRSSACCAGQG